MKSARPLAFTTCLVTATCLWAGSDLTAQAACGHAWQPGPPLAGAGGSIRVIRSWDPDGTGPLPAILALGGTFGVAGTVVSRNLVALDPATGVWTSIGGGCNGDVYDVLGMPDGSLLVVGAFTEAGGIAANRIARWDGTTWSALGAGLDGTASALLAMPNGDVVVAGAFTQAGGAPAANIARWDGSGWTPLGSGANSSVAALALLANGDLVVGGTFTQAGGINASCLARWDGTNWSSIGGVWVAWPNTTAVKGLSVLANGDLIVTGTFTLAGGIATNGLARWNSGVWSTVGPNSWPNGPILQQTTLANGDLVLGGLFTMVGGVNATNLARWNGATWSAIPNPGSWSSTVALHGRNNGDLIAAGRLGSLSGFAIDRITSFDGTNWTLLGTGSGNGPSSVVNAVHRLRDGSLVVGGSFQQVGALATNYIVLWQAGAWVPLAAGLNAEVLAIDSMPNGDIVAGGGFGVVRWNGTTWQPLGAAPVGAVRALAALDTGDLIAGGTFTSVGGQPMANVARWDGTNWSPLGTGINGTVNALLALPGGNVVAGGLFSQAGGIPAPRVAMWNGSQWSAMGGGLSSPPGFGLYAWALARATSGEVIVGGSFAMAGGIAANNIALWNGQSWTAAGSGTDGYVRALASLPGGGFVAGGSFGTAGGMPAARIARWNGTAWAPLATSLTAQSGYVLALASPGMSNDLAVGGSFTAIDGQAHCNLAMLTTTCPATIADVGNGCSGSGGLDELRATTMPWLGTTLRTTATGLPTTSFAVFANGIAPLALPLSLLSQGAPGCTAWLLPELLDVRAVTAGVADHALWLPNVPALVGATFRQQALAFGFDAGGNFVELTGSNALQFQIGVF